MTTKLTCHFDGKVLIPDQPVELPVGQPLQIHVEMASPTPPRYADFLDLAADLPDAPADLAGQHDHYLYGSPKR